MMDPTAREALVAQLIALLTQGQAHVTFAEAVADLPAGLRHRAVPGLPYTIWQLAEHVRIAQEDILAFSQGPHASPPWPGGYWPAPEETPDEARWQLTLRQIADERQQFIGLLQNPATDLLAPLPHGTGQNILREALLIADHAAYHTGEIVLLRRLLHAWK